MDGQLNWIAVTDAGTVLYVNLDQVLCAEDRGDLVELTLQFGRPVRLHGPARLEFLDILRGKGVRVREVRKP